MIEIIIKGVIIGLFISVPLGPIGMLCVQRTLNKGRKYGLATGLGATTSDLIYTLISLFFIGFVVDFLEEYRSIIRVVGSIVVIAFGIYIYRSNPSRQPIPQQSNQGSVMKDYFTSMILTLSNPIILLILIALFARFEFLDEHTTVANNIIGLVSILAGAFLWWNILTLLASKFSGRLTYRGLKMMNMIIGSVIMVIGSIGIIINTYQLIFQG